MTLRFLVILVSGILLGIRAWAAEAPPVVVELRAEADGLKYSVHDQSYNLPDLLTWIREMVKVFGPDDVVKIKADDAVKVSAINALVDQLRESGVKWVSLAGMDDPVPSPKPKSKFKPRDAAWPPVKYTEVRAYHFAFEDYRRRFIKDWKLAPEVVDQRGAPLNASQVVKLVHAMTDTVGLMSAMCYSPHHGFVFYDGNMPVFAVETCLNCRITRVVGGGDVESRFKVNYGELALLIEELGLPLYRHETAAEYAKKLEPEVLKERELSAMYGD